MHTDQIAVSPSPMSSAQATTSRKTKMPSSTRRRTGILTTYIIVPTTTSRMKASTHITVPAPTMVLPAGSIKMNKVLLGVLVGTLALVVPGVVFITCFCVKLGRVLKVSKSSCDVTPESRSEASPPISLEFTATSALLPTNSSNTLDNLGVMQTERQWDAIVNENPKHTQRDSSIRMHENPSYAMLPAELQPEYETVTGPQEYEVPVSVSSDEAIYAEIQ